MCCQKTPGCPETLTQGTKNEHSHSSMSLEKTNYLMTRDINRLRGAQGPRRQHVFAFHKCCTHADQTSWSYMLHDGATAVQTDNAQFHTPFLNHVTSTGSHALFEENLAGGEPFLFTFWLRLHEKLRQCRSVRLSACLKRHCRKLQHSIHARCDHCHIDL